MTRDQDLERHLSDWLTEGPVRAPEEVVDNAIERAAQRRQHHPLWTRLTAALDGLAWTTRSSARPLPLATILVVAVVVLAATMLSLRPLGQGPGAAPPLDPAAVVVIDGSVEVVSATDTAGGSERVLRIETDDPRIGGEAHQILATAQSPDGELGRSTGVMRMEDEWGAWEGAIEGMRYPDGTEIEYGWLHGEGAYAGFAYFHSTRDHPTEAERVLGGAIWPGEPPPMPDPSLLQADPLR